MLTALLVAVVALLALGGCARVQAGLAVQPDDTVDGEIVIATPDGAAGGKGPEVTVPPELADDVDVSSYSEGGYVGSTVRFSGLTFEQLGALNALGGVAGGRAELEHAPGRRTDRGAGPRRPHDRAGGRGRRPAEDQFPG